MALTRYAVRLLVPGLPRAIVVEVAASSLASAQRRARICAAEEHRVCVDRIRPALAWEVGAWDVATGEGDRGRRPAEREEAL